MLYFYHCEKNPTIYLYKIRRGRYDLKYTFYYLYYHVFSQPPGHYSDYYNRDVGKTWLLKASAFFIVISIILGLFYYITYYRELVLGEFAANIFLRALDSVIFYAMGYSWVKLIDAIIVSPNPKMALWRKYTNKVFAILMICSAMIYIFLLDEYYSTDQFWAEVIVIVAEIVLGLTVIVFTAAYMARISGSVGQGQSALYSYSQHFGKF